VGDYDCGVDGSLVEEFGKVVYEIIGDDVGSSYGCYVYCGV